MANDDTAPIACMLAPEDYKARMALIGDLARDALRSHRRGDLELQLVYAADAAQRVREMVRKEQDCCAFLTFSLDERPEEIRLTIAVPERARATADMALGQFLPSGQEAAACGCR